MTFESPEAIRNRRSHSIKWNNYPQDVIPLWVADMDLPLSDNIVNSLITATKNSDLGYPSAQLQQRFLAAVSSWSSRNFAVSYPTSELEGVSDIVQAIYWSISALSSQSVIVPTPSYPPFFKAVTDQGKALIKTRMISDDGISYSLDMDHFSEVAKHNKGEVLLLCSPHNPTGKVFSQEELSEIAKICTDNDLWIVSDEIHRDIVFENKHTPTALAPEVNREKVVTLISASKTFNLAGLHAAAIHIPSGTARDRFAKTPKHLLSGPSLPGLLASAVALESDSLWLERAAEQINANRILLSEFASEHSIQTTTPEGTYMAWMNLEGRTPSHTSAYDHLLTNAKVALGVGTDFDPDHGQFFVRINLATSQTVVEEALNRIAKALL